MAENCGDCKYKTELLNLSHETISKIAARAEAAELQVGALQKQLRTAQEVIEKHIDADTITGLHCVNCEAVEPEDACDCPMVVPIMEAMTGFCVHKNIEAVGEGFRKCKDCGEMEPPYAKKRIYEPLKCECGMPVGIQHTCEKRVT